MLCSTFQILFLLGFEISVQAQSNVELQASSPSNITAHLRFQHITISDGLSQGMVNAIYQDSKGFLWFGTLDGLNRYDGYNFRIFRNNPFDSTSISGNYITTITEDHAGRLRIGTGRNGLNCFDPATETFRLFKHDPKNPNSLSSNVIHTICTAPPAKHDQSTTVWIGTA